MINEGENILKPSGEIMRNAGVNYRTAIKMGNPAAELLEEAERGKFDLMILGKQGVGRVERFLIGSVSSRVASHSKIPVLIV